MTFIYPFCTFCCHGLCLGFALTVYLHLHLLRLHCITTCRWFTPRQFGFSVYARGCPTTVAGSTPRTFCRFYVPCALYLLGYGSSAFCTLPTFTTTGFISYTLACSSLVHGSLVPTHTTFALHIRYTVYFTQLPCTLYTLPPGSPYFTIYLPAHTYCPFTIPLQHAFYPLPYRTWLGSHHTFAGSHGFPYLGLPYPAYIRSVHWFLLDCRLPALVALPVAAFTFALVRFALPLLLLRARLDAQFLLCPFWVLPFPLGSTRFFGSVGSLPTGGCLPLYPHRYHLHTAV